jgi:hypothetical protein
VTDVPPAVVTVTSTVAAAATGAVTVMELVESAVTEPADVPKCTLLALARLVPVMVTVVPPLVGPLVGLIPDTVGGAT